MFGSLSSPFNKRKRVSSPEDFEYFGKSLTRPLTRVNLQIEEGEAHQCFAKVLSCSALVLYQLRSISIFANIHKPSIKLLASISSPKPFFNRLKTFVDGKRGTNNSLDVVLCSAEGHLLMVNAALDGTVFSTEHHVSLSQEEERVTALSYTGKVLLLGTSSGDLYLIRRSGGEVTADRLLRQQNVLVNLIYTGAKLMGLGTAPSEENSVLRVLSLTLPPGTQTAPLLLSVGGEATLWGSNWAVPGRERVLWSSPLTSTLLADVRSFHPRTRGMKLLDVDLLPIESTDRVFLLVLSASREGSDDSYNLWLHVLQVLVSGSTSSEEREAQYLLVRHRSLLSERAAVPDGATCFGHADGCTLPLDPSSSGSEVQQKKRILTPKLHRAADSWRLFVSWSQHPIAGRSLGGAAPGTTPGLCAAHLDLLNLPTLHAAGGVAGPAGGLEGVRCGAVVETGITVDGVLSLGTVSGIDGVILFRPDGALDALCPPLASHSAAVPTLPPNNTLGNAIPSLPAPAELRVKAEALLRSVAAGELEVLEACAGLRDIWISVDPATVFSATHSVSRQILDLRTTSLSGPSRPATGHLSGHQFVHRLVNFKLDCHRRLLQTLELSDGLLLDRVHQTLLRHHQQVLLSHYLLRTTHDTYTRLHSTDTSTTINPNVGVGRLETVDLFQRTTYEQALALVSNGLRRILGSTGDSKESGEDLFYANTGAVCEGFLQITLALQDQLTIDETPNNQQPSPVLPAAYGLMSLVLLALQGTAGPLEASDAVGTSGGEGRSVRERDFLARCDPKVLESQELLVGLLLTAVRTHQRLHGTFPETFIVRGAKRVREFCEFTLQSFVYAREETEEWCTRFNSLLDATADLLLLLPTQSVPPGGAFSLLARHLHSAGLMGLRETHPELGTALDQLLSLSGHEKGTFSVPLAIRCFEWLEQRQRFAEIILLGSKSAPALLEVFLSSRASLAWMRHLQQGRSTQATLTLSTQAHQEPRTRPAKTLLSLAKLSAVLALDESPRGSQPVDRVTPEKGESHLLQHVMSPAPWRETGAGGTSRDQAGDAREMALVEEAVGEVNGRLAVLRAQETLHQMCPSAFSDPERVQDLSFLIRLVSSLVFPTPCSSSAPQLNPDTHCSLQDLGRGFGMALSLLSMQLDFLSGLPQLREKTGPDPLSLLGAGQGTPSSRWLSSRSEDLQKELDALQVLLVGLWAAALARDGLLWEELGSWVSDGAAVSAETERTVRSRSFFFSCLTSACALAAGGSIRAAVVPQPGSPLLQEVLSATQSLQKGLEGVATTEAAGSSAWRVVQSCVELAVQGEPLLEQLQQ